MKFFSRLFRRSSEFRPTDPKNAADAGRGLRRMMLTTPPEKFGARPTDEFPRVYGVLMDRALGGGPIIATVFSASTGAASLYTTSGFGVIGGEQHETVRAAALEFVRAADRHFDAAMPTEEFPYPASDRVRFYLLTFGGVRVIDMDLASFGGGTYRELFRLGQAVLTELRLIAEKHP